MQCREFADRLNDILDKRGQPLSDGDLLAHAAQCEPCAHQLAGQELLLGVVRGWSAPGPRAGFAQRVVAQVGPAAPVNRRSTGNRIWLALGTVLAAAAAMLLAVSLVWYARQGEPLAANSDAGPGAVDFDHPSRRIRGGPGGGTLALGQSSWIIEAPRLPDRLSQNYHHALDNLAATLPETVQRFDEVERYAPGIKPLRVSFTVLLNALWRALPGGQDEPDSPPQATAWWLDSAAVA